MDIDLETFLDQKILTNFFKDTRNVSWQGHGVLDIDSDVHYFSITKKNYLLISEDTPNLEIKQIEEDAVPSHQSLRQVPTLQSSEEPWCVIYQPNDKYIPGITGYFSLFQIVDKF